MGQPRVCRCAGDALKQAAPQLRRVAPAPRRRCSRLELALCLSIPSLRPRVSGSSRQFSATIICHYCWAARSQLYKPTAAATLTQCLLPALHQGPSRPGGCCLLCSTGSLSRNKTDGGGFHAGTVVGLSWKPRAAARRLRAAILRWRCCSS